jgi:hypothetical protein
MKTGLRRVWKEIKRKDMLSVNGAYREKKLDGVS